MFIAPGTFSRWGTKENITKQWSNVWLCVREREYVRAVSTGMREREIWMQEREFRRNE